MLSRVLSATAQGVDALPVEVEVDITMGTGERLVGLPDAAVKESLHRVRSALTNNRHLWPIDRRVTINLAPADCRKEGPIYDLPIALGMIVSSDETTLRNEKAESPFSKMKAALDDYLIVGELALDGRLRPVRGILLYTLLARALNKRGVIVPPENAQEAAVVEGVEVYAPSTLIQAVRFLNGDDGLSRISVDVSAFFRSASNGSGLDMSEVRGQSEVKRAMTVAAAGGHNILLVGPPGSGKSMITSRIPTILPPMSLEEALETTKVYSIAGELDETSLVTRRPFRRPHHTTSFPGLVGGGADPKPGEISLAHNGVLFLDEFPEFETRVKEALRQPLEDRQITIARAMGTYTFPANIMLVAAMNPCPCGHFGDPKKKCCCSPQQVKRYFARISGPLLDRLDIHVEVPHVSFTELSSPTPGASSSELRNLVIEARAIQTQRFRASGTHSNAAMNDRELQEFCRPEPEARDLLKNAVDEMGFSARSYSRILKVARTIADLEDAGVITADHVAEAIQYRTLDREMTA